MAKGSCFTLFVSVTLLGGCAPGEVGVGDDSATESGELRQCAPGATVAGVDVAYYQGTINWATVADVNRGNKSFTFVRVSDGTTFPDPKFASYWPQALAHGLYRGAYQYFRASDDPIAQADLLLDAIGHQLGPTDLPPVLDLETKDGMSSATVTSRALKWLQHVEAALGRKPIIYTGVGFTDQIGDPSSLGAYPLWVANWTTSCPLMPPAWHSWIFWQNKVTHSAQSIGLNGEVDLDVFNGDAAALAAYAGPTGP
jgi:lysozyme